MPVELLIEICSYLDPVSLSCVCQVSRLFYEVAVSRLYQRILIKEDQGSLFAARIDQKPALARCVRSMKIHYHRPWEVERRGERREEWGGKPRYAEAFSPVLARMDRLQTLSIKGCRYEDSYRDLQAGDEIPVILSEAWQLNESAKFHDLFLQSVSLPILTNLRKCELNFSDSKHWDLSLRDSIFLHPHHQRLSLLGATIKDFCCFDESRRHSTSLEELSMRACDVPPTAFRKLLAVPRALRQLNFTGVISGMPRRGGQFRQQYVDAMQQQAHSLKALTLTMPWDVQPSNPPLDFQSLSALEDLTTTSLIIGGDITGGWHAPEEHRFPSSLKHLRVWGVPGSITGHLEYCYVDAIRRWVAEGTLANLTSFTRSSVYDRTNIQVFFRPAGPREHLARDERGPSRPS
ncbi:hypothetical protein BDW62DRAFT_219238 [Aspergillus aurantiobrunneus]